MKRDHREVDRLFEAISGTEDGERREAVFGELLRALTIHGRLEETIFYPALRTTTDARLLALTSLAHEEHRDVKILLAELSSLPGSTARFMEKLSELKASVERHVREEEDEVFPLAEQALGLPRLRALGGRIVDARPAEASPTR